MRIGCGLLAVFGFALFASDNYMADVELWRKAHADSLNTDAGALTISALFWLQPGDNTLGSAPSSRIVLPAGRAPERVGTITWHNDKLFFRAAGRLTVSLNGKPYMRTAELRIDDPAPDVIGLPPDLVLPLFRRGNRIGVQLLDRQSKLRREFSGLRWYPINRKWRVEAQFVPVAEPRHISFLSDEKNTQEMTSPGYAEFTADGKTCRLTALQSGERLLFIFSDTTGKNATYRHARYLYSELPRRGKVTLDFNKVENPPSAFSPHAACPLPPPENRLDVAIEAGETTYGKQGS